jgi:hypothetical protein
MFMVFYRSLGKLYVEQHTSEGAADARALHIRRTWGVSAWVETDWGEYRYVR